ncbi:hypothetical protein [Microbacterium thalassium]|uniref:Uncharacterized protein n=1 Tax=Microbacterium thalassium TaxID=362649 RepID=A0A7X0KUB1_9MICO|nr:hypothetical protein [Microbacterium thalassium]MBB6390990.1 hypothetical protein [Microbacterium thalassium]GLK24839.1 hypothetical protein GCM10017607_21570 [Microbacterium thalassium]
MARTGGRNMWIAVPATTVSLAVVAALVWLALPMVPVAWDWVGQTLRDATLRAQETGDEEPVAGSLDLDALDCRDLYPENLWAELTWTADVSLAQDHSPPPTAAAGLAEEVSADVAVTCTWTRGAGGSIVTTLAEVDGDAETVVQDALRAEGFSCNVREGVLDCARLTGRVREEHTLSGRLWLVSLESGWQPAGYGDRLDAWLFG